MTNTPDINIGVITESLTNKADIDLSNTTAFPADYITQRYNDADSCTVPWQLYIYSV